MLDDGLKANTWMLKVMEMGTAKKKDGGPNMAIRKQSECVRRQSMGEKGERGRFDVSAWF